MTSSTIPSAAAPHRLLDPSALGEVQRELDTLGVEGWLLYDFRDQNPLAHGLLELGKTTRRAFALFPARGTPRLLRHAIEASSWRHWPWEVTIYSGHEGLDRALAALLRGVRSVAMETSPGSRVPTVDRVPGGVLDAVRAAGVERIVSSGDLISRYHSAWGPAGWSSHLRATDIVRETAMEAFRRAARAAGAGAPLTEAGLMTWIVGRLRERGLAEQVACSVATGRNASDAHYHPIGEGDPLEPESLVLIDLWGAEPGGIPADQTWMGWLGDSPDPRSEGVFEAVREARDAALAFLQKRWEEGIPVLGYEVDRVARESLAGRGLEEAFVHRLGHSIDRELHGSGPNLDDLETRDDRTLRVDTGFSVEPGVYLPGEIGVRSEVNVYWSESGPRVTPAEMQETLLCFPLRE